MGLPPEHRSAGWWRKKIVWRGSSARKWNEHAPFQFALSTRAGTDCVGHVIRVLTDANPTATVLSVDAYDHVFRGAMLSKLLSEPALHGLLPFVRAMYSEPSHYTWRDDSGNLHDIVQCEGGEQGDPLKPFWFKPFLLKPFFAHEGEELCWSGLHFCDDVER